MMPQQTEPLKRVEDRDERLAAIVPIERGRRGRPNPIAQAERLANATYHGARTCAVRSYSFASTKTARLLRGVRGRLDRAREHNPLQLVLLVGGMAFILGAALRIWRSKRNT
jgi:hypothetical protein